MKNKGMRRRFRRALTKHAGERKAIVWRTKSGRIAIQGMSTTNAAPWVKAHYEDNRSRLVSTDGARRFERLVSDIRQNTWV